MLYKIDKLSRIIDVKYQPLENKKHKCLILLNKSLRLMFFYHNIFFLKQKQKILSIKLKLIYFQNTLQAIRFSKKNVKKEI